MLVSRCHNLEKIVKKSSINERRSRGSIEAAADDETTVADSSVSKHICDFYYEIEIEVFLN